MQLSEETKSVNCNQINQNPTNSSVGKAKINKPHLRKVLPKD